MLSYIKERWLPINLIFGAILILTMLPYAFLYTTTSFKIVHIDQLGSIANIMPPRTALLLGAGVLPNGEPNPILKERLITAGKAYQSGSIDKFILSGNNDAMHNEVDVMTKFLVDEYDIPVSAILMDGFGYRTYDSCVRTAEVFGEMRVVIITSKYHLPRSMFLCEKAGLEVIGLHGDQEISYSRWHYSIRELLASYKALIDVYLIEPEVEEELY